MILYKIHNDTAFFLSERNSSLGLPNLSLAAHQKSLCPDTLFSIILSTNTLTNLSPHNIIV